MVQKKKEKKKGGGGGGAEGVTASTTAVAACMHSYVSSTTEHYRVLLCPLAIASSNYHINDYIYTIPTAQLKAAIDTQQWLYRQTSLICTHKLQQVTLNSFHALITPYDMPDNAFPICLSNIMGCPSQILTFHANWRSWRKIMVVSGWLNPSASIFYEGIASAAQVLWQGKG